LSPLVINGDNKTKQPRLIDVAVYFYP